MTKPSRRCHPACPHQGGVGLATPGYSTVCMRNGMRWDEGLMRLLVLLLPTQFCWYHQHAASVRDDLTMSHHRSRCQDHTEVYACGIK
jgi:hypothetical protein